MKIKTNFGKINGRRVMTFKVTGDGMVLRSGFTDDDVWDWGESSRIFFIPARESFRRWKIARKAWHSRKWKNQIPLPL